MRTMLLFISYVWVTTLAGLAIHPYKSVKRMVFSERILLPVTLSPAIGIVVLLAVGRLGSYVLDLTGIWREGMGFLLGTTLVGLLMWQGLLLALIVRFWRVRL